MHLIPHLTSNQAIHTLPYLDSLIELFMFAEHSELYYCDEAL